MIQQRQDLQTAVTQLRADHTQLTTDILTATSTKKEVEAEWSKLRTDTETARKENNTAQRTLRETTLQLEYKENRSNHLDTRVYDLSNELDRLRSTVEQFAMEQARLQRKVAEYRNLWSPSMSEEKRLTRI